MRLNHLIECVIPNYLRCLKLIMFTLSLDDYSIILILVLKCMCSGTPLNSFSFNNGVKQGGVLSPILFSIYIDSLLQKPNGSGLGGHVDRTFAVEFGYADGLALISPSLSGVRQRIKICEQYAMKYSIVLTLS